MFSIFCIVFSMDPLRSEIKLYYYYYYLIFSFLHIVLLLLNPGFHYAKFVLGILSPCIVYNSGIFDFFIL